MINQRVERIVEHMSSGALSTAEDLIKLELNERFTQAKEKVKTSLVGSLLENKASSTVKNLGEVTLDAGAGEIRLAVSGLKEAVEKASEFAAFCDGADPSKYSAHLNESQTAVVVRVGKETCYEMVLEGTELVNVCQVSSQDLINFKKSGTLTSV